MVALSVLIFNFKQIRTCDARVHLLRLLASELSGGPSECKKYELNKMVIRSVITAHTHKLGAGVECRKQRAAE